MSEERSGEICSDSSPEHLESIKKLAGQRAAIAVDLLQQSARLLREHGLGSAAGMYDEAIRSVVESFESGGLLQ